VVVVLHEPFSRACASRERESRSERERVGRESGPCAREQNATFQLDKLTRVLQDEGKVDAGRRRLLVSVREM